MLDISIEQTNPSSFIIHILSLKASLEILPNNIININTKNDFDRQFLKEIILETLHE